MEPELEGCHDAEIAPATPQCPEKVLVLPFAGANQFSVGRDDISRDEDIDSQPKFASGPAKAAAQRQAGHSGRGIDAKRRGKPERLRLSVEVCKRSAGLNASREGRRIDPHRLHQGEIDQQSALAHCIAGDVVASRAHSDQQPFVAREPDRIDDVVGSQTAHHEAGPSVQWRSR